MKRFRGKQWQYILQGKKNLNSRESTVEQREKSRKKYTYKIIRDSQECAEALELFVRQSGVLVLALVLSTVLGVDTEFCTGQTGGRGKRVVGVRVERVVGLFILISVCTYTSC